MYIDLTFHDNAQVLGESIRHRHVELVEQHLVPDHHLSPLFVPSFIFSFHYLLFEKGGGGGGGWTGGTGGTYGGGGGGSSYVDASALTVSYGVGYADIAGSVSIVAICDTGMTEAYNPATGVVTCVNCVAGQSSPADTNACADW